MEPRIPVPPEHSLAFTEVAQGARLSSRVLLHAGDPRPGSNFERVAELYPFEKVSDRTYAYLSAAYEHLLFWADYAAPLKFHPDQVTNFTLRPAYTLARAAMESAAQAVWILSSPDPIECVRRHLCLMRWDYQEHVRSIADPDYAQRIRDQDAELVSRVAGIFAPEQIRPPKGYWNVIQKACESDDSLALDLADAKRIWTAASGAAHGKFWPTHDLQHVIPGEEYEPGHYRAVTLPDPAGMAEALKAAYTVAQLGVIRHAHWCGADVAAITTAARVWLAENITLRPDAEPDVLARLRGDLPRTHGHDAGA